MELFNCDCQEILSGLDKNFAIISDPPYGCKNDCNYTRFTGGLKESRNHHKGIQGDDVPFDPSPLLQFKHVALFGYQFFGDKLPVGTVCVWVKKRQNQLGKFLSDAELCWLNKGKGCYVFHHVWNGFDRESERGKTLHPTQKPVAVFRWIIEKMKLPVGTVIVDPYMGAGACGVAAKELGFDFIGCEIEPTYFAVAKERIEKV